MVQVPVKITKLINNLEFKTFRVIEESPKSIKARDVALVECTPLRRFSIEKMSDFQELGRFALRDNNRLIAVGIVIDF